jgi:hypothetical protein
MSSASIAENFVAPTTPASIIVPLRNVLLTLTLTISSLALAGSLWREQGYEMLIVTMGWPHVILGFVFYFGKVMRGEAKARGAFVLLALFTLAIWIVHYNYAITGLIYLYFLYHAFRDEITVYFQTRARHRPGPGVYAVAGVGPAILLILLIPQQQNFRHDLRRIEVNDAQVQPAGTLISFKPVPNSRGRDFYFYLQAPHTAGLRAFTTPATTADVHSTGEVLVNDRAWPQAADLVFRPHYANESAAVPVPSGSDNGTVPVLLTGGHRVGQTFRAEQNNLDGIWLPINRLDAGANPTNIYFHLASPPLLPYSTAIADIRLILIALVGALVIWKLLPKRGQSNQLWIYLLVIAGGFAFTQITLKSSNNAGYSFPLIFQFVVVFHYWSWYVFSYDKLRTLKGAPTRPSISRYDAMLASLRSAWNFTTVMVLLNLVSGMGVVWYYKLNGPPALRFPFDYNYFLYFLVFHVTFSFNPKPGPPAALSESRAVRT